MRRIMNLMRGLRRAFKVTIAIGVLALAAGFFWYASQVPSDEIALERDADGIVVLTGGPERIGEAIDLLAAKRGQRLLITGVNPTTRPEELSRLVPRFDTVSGNIDFDKSALNTIGNARETRRWVLEQGFHSIIVVTSSWHMPRALAELAHQLPDVELIPYPVVTDRQRGESWWHDPWAARMLVAEYVKYLVAVVRMRLEPSPSATARTDSSVVAGK